MTGPNAYGRTTARFEQSPRSSRNEALELLRALFTAQIVRPSERLWIVSPWISDVDILDDRARLYRGMGLKTQGTMLSLVDVLLHCLEQGTKVSIVTRPGHSEAFVRELTQRAAGGPGLERLRTEYRDELHKKGVVSDDFAFVGSMNITHNGLDKLEETLVLDIEAHAVSSTLMQLRDDYPEAHVE